MWIINTKDGYSHQITNPDTSYEAWQEFLTKHYTQEDITGMSIQLFPDIPPASIIKPKEECEWFIEKIATAIINMQQTSGPVSPTESRNIGLVAGYRTKELVVKLIAFYNGAIQVRHDNIEKT